MPCFNRKVEVVIVAGSMISLNVAEIFFIVGTFIAPLMGSVETTLGHIPAMPASSLTFLQLMAITINSNAMNHLFVKKPELLHVCLRVFSVPK